MTMEEKELVRKLLVETITTLCRNSMKYKINLTVDGLIGITIDHQEVFLVKVNESLDMVTSEISKSNEPYEPELGEVIEGKLEEGDGAMDKPKYDAGLTNRHTPQRQLPLYRESDTSHSLHYKDSLHTTVPDRTKEHERNISSIENYPTLQDHTSDPPELIHADFTVVKEEISSDEDNEDDCVMVTTEGSPAQSQDVDQATRNSTSQPMGAFAVGVWMPSNSQATLPSPGLQVAPPPPPLHPHGGLMPIPQQPLAPPCSLSPNMQYNSRVLNYVVSTYTEEIKDCPACYVSFPNTKMLAKHLLIHMHDPPNSQPCPFCLLDIKSKANMNSHIKTRHLGQKYICIICGSAHTRKNVTVRHVLKSHKEVVFQQ